MMEFISEPSTPMGPIHWRFHMRRYMQEIVPRVYLGPYASASKSNGAELMEKGITHMVMIRSNCEAAFLREWYRENIKYLTITMDDHSSCLIPYFRQVNQFIDECLNSGGKVLVYGITGMNYSASLVIAYLMYSRRMSFNAAYNCALRRRMSLHLQHDVMTQIQEYQPILEAELCNYPMSDENALSLKRPLEYDDQ